MLRLKNKKGTKAEAFVPKLILSLFYILLCSLRKSLIRFTPKCSTSSLASPCRVIYANSPVFTYPNNCIYGSYPAVCSADMTVFYSSVKLHLIHIHRSFMLHYSINCQAIQSPRAIIGLLSKNCRKHRTCIYRGAV